MNQQLLAVGDEVGGHGDGRVAGQAVDAEQSEVVAVGDPGLPFGLVQGGVPGLDEHAGLLEVRRAVR